MNKKRILLVFIITFIVVSILVKGVKYEKPIEQINDINKFIMELHSVEQNDGGKKFHVTGDNASIVFDFSKAKNIYGIVFENEIDLDISGTSAYLMQESENFDADIEQQVINIGGNNVYVSSSKPINILRLNIDRDLDIAEFRILVYDAKSNSILPFAISFIISLIITIFWLMINKHLIQSDCDIGLRSICNKDNIKFLLIVIGEAIVSCLIESAYYILVHGARLNPFRAIFLFSICLLVTVFIKFRHHIFEKLHILYFIVLIVIGTTHIICSPPELGESWDDTTHYARTSYIAKVFDNVETESEHELYLESAEDLVKKYNYTEEGRKTFFERFSSIENECKIAMISKEQQIVPSFVAYVPAALGIAFGRGIGLPFLQYFMLGKWFNLLCYAFIFSYAVYLLRERGYIIVSFLGLIPTSIHMACNYSYDWWVIAFSVLGYSMFINILNKRQKIGYIDIAKILIILVLAFCPKPIYFPFLIPVFLLNSKKSNKLSRMMVIISMLFLVISFAIPTIFTGRSLNDMRGGTDVNSIEQMKFIIFNPIQYAMILFGFLLKYLSLDTCNMALTAMYGYGHGNYYVIIVIILVLGTIAESKSWDESDNKIIRRFKLICGSSIFLSLVLVSTALYVSFTPVMYETINGVQERYILPLLLPFLLSICKTNIDVPVSLKHKVALYGNILLIVIFYCNMYTLCISIY